MLIAPRPRYESRDTCVNTTIDNRRISARNKQISYLINSERRRLTLFSKFRCEVSKIEREFRHCQTWYMYARLKLAWDCIFSDCALFFWRCCYCAISVLEKSSLLKVDVCRLGLCQNRFLIARDINAFNRGYCFLWFSHDNFASFIIIFFQQYTTIHYNYILNINRLQTKPSLTGTAFVTFSTCNSNRTVNLLAKFSFFRK